MSTTKQGEQRKDQEASGGPQRDAAVGQHVLGALGQPGGLHAVQVRRLWGDHYRVNVLVGGDVTSLKVAHSYFLVADGDGRIVSSTPAVARVY